MRQGRIVILHVFDDEKFFDSASDFFDSIPGIEIYIICICLIIAHLSL